MALSQSELLARAIEIRDATLPAENTADRVGSLLVELVKTGVKTYSPASTYEPGSYALFNDNLFRALAAIAVGETPALVPEKWKAQIGRLDTFDDTAKRGLTAERKGWTNQRITLVGGLNLENLPPTTRALPSLLLDTATGIVYTGTPQSSGGTGGTGGGTATVTVTEEWLRAIANWITIWQESINSPGATIVLPPVPQLGGGVIVPTDPTTTTARVNFVTQRFDPTPDVYHVLELNASGGDFFQLRAIGRDGTTFNGQWNDATRYDGTTALGSYVYYGIGLLPQGKYKAQGQPKGNINPANIVSIDFEVAGLVGLEEFTIKGNVKPAEAGPVEQYELWQKYNDGSYKKFTGFVQFVPTIFVPGITLTESGLLEIPDGTISEPTPYIVRAYNGTNTELPIVLQPKATGPETPVALAPINFIRLDDTYNGKAVVGNVRTQIEIKIRTEHPAGTFFSETPFDANGIAKIGGEFDATGATIERPFGYGQSGAGEWLYIFTARPVDQVTYPGEQYWKETRYLNINSGSTTPTDPTTPPTTGVTTPWELDVEESKVLKGEWEWFKNNPLVGQGSQLNIYWTVQGITEFEINYPQLTGPPAAQWYNFPNIGNYGGGVNSKDGNYNLTAGNSQRMLIRKKGTTAILHDFTLTMPQGVSSQPRTTFYVAP